MKQVNAHEKILDVAEGLIQELGFNAFSYRDIATKVGIKTSSVHYHFPTKIDLGCGVVERHRERVKVFLDDLLLDQSKDAKQKLESYLDAIFAGTYKKQQRMCLGGMLAADVLTLDDRFQKEVRLFFRVNEAFLEEVIALGVKTDQFSSIIEIKTTAMNIMALLEGGLLLARLYREEKRLMALKKQAIKMLY